MVDLGEHTSAVRIQRIGWSLVFFSLVAIGTNDWAQWSAWNGFSWFSPLIVLAGLVGLVASWSVRDERLAALGHWAFATALVTVAIANGAQVLTNQFYATDSAAFQQLGTSELLRGQNPYAALLHVGQLVLQYPQNFWTYTLSGSFVDRISYPAGSFLLQAPFQYFGVDHLPSDWIDLGAWIVSGLILYAVVRRELRFGVVLAFLSSAYLYIFTNGGTDALFIPFLIVAAWALYEPTMDHPRARAWLGPIALGVACSIKQTPWFAVAFFLLALYLEGRRRQRRALWITVRYGLLVAATFAVLNLPFVLWNARAWWHDTILPLRQPLIPDGQGFVTLATHGFVHVVRPQLLTAAGATLTIALLFVLLGWFTQLRHSWLFLVPIVFLVADRSLTSYFIDFFPAALALAASDDQTPSLPRAPRPRRVAIAGVSVSLLASAVLVVAGFSQAPLSVQLRGFTLGSNIHQMASLTVRLTNTTNTVEHPHVMVVVGAQHPNGFWRSADGGPVVLAPHASRTFTLVSSSTQWTPSYNQNWLVEVALDHPAALVTTPAMLWRLNRPPGVN